MLFPGMFLIHKYANIFRILNKCLRSSMSSIDIFSSFLLSGSPPQDSVFIITERDISAWEESGSLRGCHWSVYLWSANTIWAQRRKCSADIVLVYLHWGTVSCQEKKPLPSSTYNLLWITIAQRCCGRRWGETCAGVVDTEVNRKQGWGEKTLVVECACLLSLHANFLGRLLNRILICSVFMIQNKRCRLRGQYNLIINTNAWTYMRWWAHTCTKKCILYV